MNLYKTNNSQINKNLQQRRFSGIQSTLPKVNNLIQEELIKTKKGFNDQKSKTFRNSVIIVFVCVFGFLSYDSIVGMVLDYNFQLRPNGIATGAWTMNPIPINTCFYIFGISNGPAFLRGAKPNMVDNGPFCYDLYRIRTVLEWNDDSVKYTERFRFQFNEKLSQPLDTSITMANLPIFAGVMAAKGIMENYYVGFLGPIVFNAMTAALRASGEQLIETITARQLMESRKLPIIEYLDMVLAPIRSIGIPVPNFKEGFMGITEYAFGITTSGGAFEIGPYFAYRRSEKGHVVGHIFKYADETQYSMFKTPCNRLGGSDAIFHPRPLEAKYFYIYMAHQLCRVLRFNRNGTEYFAGSQVVRYQMDPQMFDYRLKRNKCFCINDKPWHECDGWNDMSPCLFGVPVGISFPHFLHSSRRLREVSGLNPSKDKHQGFILMEPQLGVPVSAKITLQPVLSVTPISFVPGLTQLPKVKLPLMWVHVFAGADTPTLATGLFIGSNSVRYGATGFLLGGFGLLGAMFFKKIYKQFQERK